MTDDLAAILILFCLIFVIVWLGMVIINNHYHDSDWWTQ